MNYAISAGGNDGGGAQRCGAALALSRQSAPRRLRHRGHWACVIAAVMLLQSGGVWAQVLDLEPYVAARVERQSNVFRFSDEVAEATDTQRTADTVQRYTAGLDASYAWTQQTIVALVQAHRYDHDEFGDLDRTEHSTELGYQGRFLNETDGMLTFASQYRLAPFEDRRSTERIMERDNSVEGGLEIPVLPEWALLTGARYRRLNSPLPEVIPLPASGTPGRPASPDFRLNERTFNLGVQYGIDNEDRPVAEAPLLVGVMLEHQQVRFVNLNRAPEGAGGGVLLLPGLLPGLLQDEVSDASNGYRLLVLEANARYTVSGMSTLYASLGATQFKDDEQSKAQSPTLTGSLRYRRNLSAVTEVSVGVFRRFSPFISSGAATTDTGFMLGARWEPLLDLMVEVDYTRTRSNFGGRSSFAAEDTGRSDTLQGGALSVSYPLFRRVGVRVFASYDERNSSLGFNDFSDNRVGAELAFRWE